MLEFFGLYSGPLADPARLATDGSGREPVRRRHSFLRLPHEIGALNARHRRSSKG